MQGPAPHDAPIDVVYTWVDDRFPGYLDLLNRHASDKRDLNPNRTRDNLELLRFSLRSVARHLPWVRRIHLLTCRPQVPGWLDPQHPRLRLVHHDAVIAPRHLPTFSSFAIVSHLHLLPDLSRQFLYFEDDFLANSDALLPALRAEDGRPIVNLSHRRILPAEKLNPETSSPWNLALANSDAHLSQRFGPGPRRQVIHGPQLFDRDVMAEGIATYPEVFEATRAAKFRSAEGVPPEVFLPNFMIETGQAVLAEDRAAARAEGYASLENFLPWTWAQLKRIDLRRPLSIALNDSFEARPNPRVERLVRAWLRRKFPTPAPWELA